jgi:hypothetical protein
MANRHRPILTAAPSRGHGLFRSAAHGGAWQAGGMCRNIRVLHNFDPPATAAEIEAAALQYVRKVSGTTRPSAANQEAFDAAVQAVAEATRTLMDSLVTKAPARDREVEATKARARAAERYGPRPATPG